MRLRKSILGALLVILAGFFLAVGAIGQERSGKERMLTQAYVRVVRAEQAVKDGQKKEALDYYAGALQMFRQLLADYPDWRSAVVREQIPHCINEIENLLEDKELDKLYGDKYRRVAKSPLTSGARAETARGPASARGAKKPPAATLAEPRISSRERELLRTNAQLRSRLMGLEMTAGELRKRMEDSPRIKAAERRIMELGDENEALKAELMATREENTSLRERIHSLQEARRDQEIARDPTTAAIEVAGLKLELKSSREDFRALEERNAALQAKIDDMWVQGPDLKGAGEGPDAVELLRSGNLRRARKRITDGLSQSPTDRKLRLMLGILYCKEGNFEAAVRTLKKLVADEKEDVNVQAHLALGGAYMALGSYDNAKLELEMVIAFDPDMSEGHFNLAQVLLAGDPQDPEGARESYVEALKRGAKADPGFEKQLATALERKKSSASR